MYIFTIKVEKKWKTIDPVLCTSESYKPRLGLASCLIGIPKEKKNTKLLMSKSNEEINQPENLSSTSTNEKEKETKKGKETDKNQENNLNNINDSTNSDNNNRKIQEISFNEEENYLKEVSESDNVNSIALFGGADFYGIYNDLYLMKI
ncbi:hypothetical protein BCR32DRAFT_40603 [Anaeromyces robustus]|uniref:Uncharacterized protein n=1 Tax=Anaeromyces robustus TaxID=1754192 RepID=A0A1Y1WZJ9_9FUNG|nr:hypothetical protein BCR32DRAFT_40603 [Anaeromyces robustus]|eukprot:ORX79017.1 hypothetical protein BCR32DRAFT_40603 [Anaeromyces robustus]